MADYNVDTVGVQIVSSAEEGIKSLDTLIAKATELTTKFEGISQQANNAKTAFTGLGNVNVGTTTSTGTTSGTGTSTTDTPSTTNASLNKSMKNFFNLGKAILIFRTVQTGFKKTVGHAVEATENFNLFNVAMGEGIEGAMQFQQTMSSAFGMNISDSMRYQGFFQSLAENLGIVNESATIMSENLTKLTYDLASLYNTDIDSTYNKLQSGIVGQTKPLRSFGIDVTAQTLQGYLDEFNMRVPIQELTQAEKVLLRYIAILDQSRLAQGNMARELESPANQMRVFTQQVKEAGIWIGNVFMGLWGRILPYANAIIMVIKEIFKSIATLMGFSWSDYDYGTPSYDGAYLDVADDIGKVGSSAKKAQKDLGLFGWDKVNNIKSPTETGGSGGGGVGSLGTGSYYDMLTEKLKGYDNLMGDVSMKAKNIRDDMLEWLGFTPKVDALTGEITGLSWSFKDASLGAKLLMTGLGVLAGIKIVSWIGGAINSFKILTATIGSSGVVGGIKALITSIGTYTAVNGGKLIPGILQGTKAWLGTLSPLAKAGIGVVGLAGSYLVASSGAKQFAKDGELTTSSALKMGGGFAGAVASGALLGSIIPGVGTAVGATVGGIVGGFATLLGSTNAYNKELQAMRHEANLFDEVGIPIQDFVDSVTGSMDAVTGSSDEITKWIVSHRESKESLKDVISEIDLLNIKLGNSYYKASAKDVDAMTASLDQMVLEVEASSTAFTNSAIAITEKLLEEGRISKETADAVVANAMRKADAEGDAAEVMRLKTIELTQALADGEITQEDYAKQIAEMRKEVSNTAPIFSDLTTKVDIFRDKATKSINVGNYRQLENAVDDITQSYDESQAKVQELQVASVSAIDEMIKYTKDHLSEVEKAHGKESELYKNTEKELKELELTRKQTMESYADDSQALSDAVATSFGSIINEITSAGGEMTDESQAIVDDMTSILNSMGYTVDLKTGLVTAIRNGKPEVVSEFTKTGKEAGDAMTGEATKKFDNWLVNQNKKFNANKIWAIIGLKSDGKALNIQSASMSGGRISVSAYASGGFPEDGLFFANSRELVGQFSNGKTAVANNDQITTGIYNAVRSANQEVVRALVNQNGNVEVKVYMDRNSLASEMIDGIDFITSTTGKRLKTV